MCVINTNMKETKVNVYFYRYYENKTTPFPSIAMKTFCPYNIRTYYCEKINFNIVKA